MYLALVFIHVKINGKIQGILSLNSSLFSTPHLLISKSSWMTLFGLFDSPRMGIGLHVREGVKGMIFMLNSNPTILNF